MLTPHNIIAASPKPAVSFFSCDSRFVHLFKAFQNFAETSKLGYSFTCLQALKMYIAQDMNASHFIQDESFTTCLQCDCIAELLPRNSNLLKLVRKKIREKSWGKKLEVTEIGCVFTIFIRLQVLEILVKTQDGRLNNLSIYSLFPFQQLCRCNKNLLR